MSKLYTPILVVLMMIAGTALAAPPQPPSGATGPQAAPPAAETPMQPYTSSDGRFSILFPGAPSVSSESLTLKNGETVTLNEFSAEDDNGNSSYIVMYNDYAADVVSDGAQALLQRTEGGAVAGKTRLSDEVIDLHGVPGRAYTAVDSDGFSYSVHEFLAGTRFYQLIATTTKGHTAAHLDQFMNSFNIM
jgi:hypothetical protein